MRTGDDRHVLQHRFERLSILAPQDRYEGILDAFDEAGDRCVRELLPALTPMTSRLALANRQDPIEKHDSVLSPPCEIAIGRGRYPEVVVKLAKDVLQAARQGTNIG